MADAGPVLAAAVAERDHAVALLAEHEKKCRGFWCRECDRPCPDCASLRAHAERTRRQVDMLTPAETEAMFDG
jgi:hypothetical protein